MGWMNRKWLSLVSALALLAALVAGGCGGSEDAPIQADIDSGQIFECPLPGSYQGNYHVGTVREEGGNPFELEINNLHETTARGSMPEGGPFFAVEGTVSPEGDFAAEGTVEGAGITVVFLGDFVVGADGVTASGTWKSDDGLNGAWEATRVD